MEETTYFYGIVFLISTWSLVWKGLALWHASNRHERNWFIAMLVLNTAGIVELIYLFRTQRKPFFVWMIGLACAFLAILFLSFEPILRQAPGMGS
jgi:hypothetical protein